MEYFCRFLKIQCASSFLWRNVIFAAVSTNVVFHQCIPSLHENKNFRLPKIYEKDRKDHIFISFPMFPFHGNIIFSQLSFKRKCKERASFRKCVFLHKCPSSAANVLYVPQMYLMYFLLNAEKKHAKFAQDILMHLKGLIWSFYKILWIMEFRRTIRKLLTFKNTGIH